MVGQLQASFDRIKMDLTHIIGKDSAMDATVKRYKDPVYSFEVRGKEIKIKTHTESLFIHKYLKYCLNIAVGEMCLGGYSENIPVNSLILQYF